jgi:hypothetical protein
LQQHQLAPGTSLHGPDDPHLFSDFSNPLQERFEPVVLITSWMKKPEMSRPERPN